MTTLDQKRMLKLAGLLKEGVEEWIDETAPETEDDDFSDYVRDVDRDMPTSWDDEAEKEKLERMPKQMGMGRGAGLEETYIVNMKESLEEAPPPHDPEERKAAGLKPLPTTYEKGPFGEELPRGNKFGPETLKANPGLVELHETIRSLVREVLLEKAKTYKGKSMRLGGGGRFSKFVDSLKKSGKSEEQARAIAYKAGVNNYGKEKMKKMAAAGKKREAKKED